MARRILKNAWLSSPGKRDLCSVNNHSPSFGIYHYWSCSHSDEKCKKHLQLISPSKRSCFKFQCLPTINLLVQQNVRHFLLNHCDHSQGSKTSDISGVLKNNKSKNSKLKKPSAKEFTINYKISDHDLSIKLSKMQNLLKKGKIVAVFIKHDSNSESSKLKQILQDKIKASLQDAKSLRVDYSNENTTRITVKPAADGDEPSTVEAKSSAPSTQEE